MGSQGILKTTDAGAHWTMLGANVFGAAYDEPAGQFPQYDAVGKVRVDPNNSQNVVAGTKKGVFVSYDGGSNWSGPCALLAGGDRQDVTGLELANLGDTTRIIAAVGTRGFATAGPVRPRQQRRERHLRARHARERVPELRLDRERRERVRLRDERAERRRTPPSAPMHAGSGVDYGGNASTGDQLGRIDIAIAPSDPNTIYAQAQQIVSSPGTPARRCGSRTTAAPRGTSWRTRPAIALDLDAVRRQLQPELVRPGHRGRPERRRQDLRRHVRRLARDAERLEPHRPDVRLRRRRDRPRRPARARVRARARRTSC